MIYQQVIPLSDQLQFFKDYKAKLKGAVGEEKSETIIANSIFLISSGNNDILFSYFATKLRQLKYDVPTYTDLLANWPLDFSRFVRKANKQGMTSAFIRKFEGELYCDYKNSRLSLKTSKGGKYIPIKKSLYYND